MKGTGQVTEAEAVALAEKRERNKSKHMTHKRWAAVHDSVKGWHAALVDVPKPQAEPKLPHNLMVITTAISVFGVGPTIAALHRLARERGK